MSTEAPAAPVVVGLDGSAPSKRALAWAGRYARAARAPLTVIVVWRLPTSYGWPLPLPEGWSPEADAREMVERDVEEVLGSDTGTDVTTAVAEGNPAQVLTAASESASLVVVGSRGRGEFAGMLLGSVSAFLVTHAHCPVVVVRDGTEE